MHEKGFNRKQKMDLRNVGLLLDKYALRRAYINEKE